MFLSFAVGDVDGGLVAGPVASPAASVEVVGKGARLSRVRGGEKAGSKETREATRIVRVERNNHGIVYKVGAGGVGVEVEGEGGGQREGRE